MNPGSQGGAEKRRGLKNGIELKNARRTLGAV